MSLLESPECVLRVLKTPATANYSVPAAAEPEEGDENKTNKMKRKTNSLLTPFVKTMNKKTTNIEKNTPVVTVSTIYTLYIFIHIYIYILYLYTLTGLFKDDPLDAAKW